MKPEFNVELGYARNCPAPAKLNLFLHVTGQRSDGYHLLQTAFQLIGHADLLHFKRRADNRIVRVNDIAGVPAESDLVVRAATLLRSHARTQLGVDIILDKKLPMGGGLGGGFCPDALCIACPLRPARTRTCRPSRWTRPDHRPNRADTG